MKLIFRYLKPFALALTVSIVFLFVQVLCDLGLPRLMSDLVDTGIQAGGIEQGAPAAISADGVELLKVFMSEQAEATFMSGYKLAAAGTNAEAAERFPATETEDIYRFTVQDSDQAEAVGDAYTRAVYALALSMQSMEGPQAQEGTIGELQSDPLYDLVPMFMIVGATKLHHLEDAVAALSVKLGADEIASLEEPYVPHKVYGI
jgi:ATP-binding cassette subfamily B multidrug efflux pump